MVIKLLKWISLIKIGSGVNQVAQMRGEGGNLFTQLETILFDFVLEGAAADAK